MRIVRALAPLLLLVLSTAAHASPGARCAPVVSRAWVRMTPTMPMAAGFFSLRNPCATDVVLTGVSTGRFGESSMHETRIEQGISRMRPLPRVVVRPGGHVEFSPGGRHLMLMSPTAGVVPGAVVRIDLHLADGRHIPVDFVVRSAAP